MVTSRINFITDIWRTSLKVRTEIYTELSKTLGQTSGVNSPNQKMFKPIYMRNQFSG